MEDKWLDIMLEEYKTLRAESLESLKGQQTTLRFGAATLGVILAVEFNNLDKSDICTMVFLLFVPIISYLSLVIWIGEVTRMMRAGYFLSSLEKKINEKCNDTLSWESWLREKDSSGKTLQLK